jgi:hypothetical protein
MSRATRARFARWREILEGCRLRRLSLTYDATPLLGGYPRHWPRP